MQLNRVTRLLLILLLLPLFTACSRGSGDGSKSFSLSLADVSVQRLSDGEAVAVDTTDIDSGELTYQR